MESRYNSSYGYADDFQKGIQGNFMERLSLNPKEDERSVPNRLRTTTKGVTRSILDKEQVCMNNAACAVLPYTRKPKLLCSCGKLA